MYNDIYKNIKANIGLGGNLSQETVIIKNWIHSGAAEGIYMAYSGMGKIYYNEIINNYQGIIVYAGEGDI